MHARQNCGRVVRLRLSASSRGDLLTKLWVVRREPRLRHIDRNESNERVEPKAREKSALKRAGEA
eukprot:1905572-Pleurochrysis_carterae.AAC.1